MITNEQLAWLAGIVDGEGTITVWKYQCRKSFTYRPIVAIYNTDLNIISECAKIFDALKVSAHLNSHKVKKRKLCYVIETKKLSSIKIILESILPYLIGKKSRAELTLRFVNSRLAAIQKLRSKGIQSNNIPYTEEEGSLVDQLRILTKRGDESSETLCLTSQDEDKVRPS